MDGYTNMARSGQLIILIIYHIYIVRRLSSDSFLNIMVNIFYIFILTDEYTYTRIMYNNVLKIKVFYYARA